MILSRDDLLELCKPKVKSVKIEGIGEIGVSEISGADYTALQSQITGKNDQAGIESYKYGFVSACLVDADGKRLFSSVDEAKSFAAGVGKSAFEAICDAISEHNGIKASVEDAEKN